MFKKIDPYPPSHIWRRTKSFLLQFALLTFVAITVTACFHDDDDDDDDTLPTVSAPGAPTNLTAIRTPETVLSETLTWSVPASGGDPSSYKVYRTTTDPLVAEIVDEANLVISLPAVAGKTNYEFVDNVGLTRGDNWWVVSARNAGGETPSTVVTDDVVGPPGGVGDEGFGNNFSAAMIFADGVGIGGAAITGSWTNDLDAPEFDVNTGLRPKVEEVAELLAADPDTTLPHLDPATTYTVDGIDYYKQKTVSTWQGYWEDGSATPQNVTGKWGDNLISQRLTTESVIRVEMVLTKDLAPATMDPSYWMLSLYGTKDNEVYGTDGTTYLNPTAFVFAANAHLTIQKLDGNGDPDGPALYDLVLFQGDGPGNLAGEVNWRITFSLDPVAPAPVGTADNTDITAVANGVRVSANEVYIDILVE
jgi:hypothetical protein